MNLILANSSCGYIKKMGEKKTMFMIISAVLLGHAPTTDMDYWISKKISTLKLTSFTLVEDGFFVGWRLMD
jgi:hypothetical protein